MRVSQGPLDKLLDVHRRYERALEDAEALRVERDQLVLELAENRGGQRVADKLGVTRGRVNQILKRARES